MEIEDGGSLRLLGEGRGSTTSFTGVVNTVYWTGETTSIKTYNYDGDSITAHTENWYNIAQSCDPPNSESYSNATVHEATVSLTGQIATFATTYPSGVLEIASPSITCYLSGETYASIHSITILTGSAEYFISDVNGNVLDSKFFVLTPMSPISTNVYNEDNLIFTNNTGISYTYNTFTNTVLRIPNYGGNHTYNLNIQINATVRYGLCSYCATHFQGPEIRLSGSSSIFVEMTAQTISYTGQTIELERLCFQNEDEYGINKVHYCLYYNDNTSETGISATQYVVIRNNFDHASLHRDGYFDINDFVLDSETQTTVEYVNYVYRLITYKIPFVSTGEIASVQRLQSIFQIGLMQDNNQQPYSSGAKSTPDTGTTEQPLFPRSLYENYSREQQPTNIRNTNFIYSYIASSQPSLTLRLSDYVRTKTLGDIIIESGFPHINHYVVLEFDSEDEKTSLIAHGLSACIPTYHPLTGEKINDGPASVLPLCGTNILAPTLYGVSGVCGDEYMIYEDGIALRNDGFKLFNATNGAEFEWPSQYSATFVSQQIVSGYVAEFDNIQASVFACANPEITVAITGRTKSTYHTTTYICGTTRIQLVNTDNDTVLGETYYNCNINHRWITDLINRTSYIGDYIPDRFVPTSSVFYSGFTNSTTSNILVIPNLNINSATNIKLKLIADIKTYMVMHGNLNNNGCFTLNDTYESGDVFRWLCATTITRVSVPRQVLEYGFFD